VFGGLELRDIHVGKALCVPAPDYRHLLHISGLLVRAAGVGDRSAGLLDAPAPEPDGTLSKRPRRDGAALAALMIAAGQEAPAEQQEQAPLLPLPKPEEESLLALLARRVHQADPCASVRQLRATDGTAALREAEGGAATTPTSTTTTTTAAAAAAAAQAQGGALALAECGCECGYLAVCSSHSAAAAVTAALQPERGRGGSGEAVAVADTALAAAATAQGDGGDGGGGDQHGGGGLVVPSLRIYGEPYVCVCSRL
jgi:hypothetical protein